MLEILKSCADWLRAGRTFAVATIVSATGSVPRTVGTAMAVNDDGDVLGSLSGGCVEGAVFEACREAMASATARREQFGYSEADAFAVGLTCGGVLDVLIQPVYPEGHPHQQLDTERLHCLACLGDDVPAALIRRLDDNGLTGVVVLEPAEFPAGADVGRLQALVASGRGCPNTAAMSHLVGEEGELSGDGWGTAQGAASQIAAMISSGQTGILRVSPDRDVCDDDYVSLFVETRLPPPRMLVFGSNDFSAALVQSAALLGYRITVCDARPTFTSAARFPGADEVVVAQPHRYLCDQVEANALDERTVICVLTHEAKFDIPLLQLALTLPVQYVGAMGSRRSHDQRIEALGGHGVPREQLERLHSPIGLDLGAVTPQEVAVSVTAEIIAHRNQHRSAQPLSRLDGPIHSQAGEPSWT